MARVELFPNSFPPWMKPYNNFSYFGNPALMKKFTGLKKLIEGKGETTV
jgi:hypothetical protein